MKGQQIGAVLAAIVGASQADAQVAREDGGRKTAPEQRANAAEGLTHHSKHREEGY